MLFLILNTAVCASFHVPCNYSKPNKVTLVNDHDNTLEMDLNATDEDLFDTLLDHQTLNKNQPKYFDLDMCNTIIMN